MSSDQRQMPRIRKRAAIRYRTADGVTISGFITDVGPGGVGIASQRVLDEGTAIDMTVELEDGEVLTLRGTVTWTRRVPKAVQRVEKSGFGVRFTSPPPEAFYRLLSELLE